MRDTTSGPTPAADRGQPGANDPPAGAPSDHTTLLEVLAALQRAGYRADADVDDDGALCCGTCGTCVPGQEALVDDLRRLEGASDPADMATVLAVRCATCGARATAIVRYGPEAGPGDATLLRALDRHS